MLLFPQVLEASKVHMVQIFDSWPGELRAQKLIRMWAWTEHLPNYEARWAWHFALGRGRRRMGGQCHNSAADCEVLHPVSWCPNHWAAHGMSPLFLYGLPEHGAQNWLSVAADSRLVIALAAVFRDLNRRSRCWPALWGRENSHRAVSSRPLTSPQGIAPPSPVSPPLWPRASLHCYRNPRTATSLSAAPRAPLAEPSTLLFAVVARRSLGFFCESRKTTDSQIPHGSFMSVSPTENCSSKVDNNLTGRIQT